jgi:hypothetical protein
MIDFIVIYLLNNLYPTRLGIENTQLVGYKSQIMGDPILNMVRLKMCVKQWFHGHETLIFEYECPHSFFFNWAALQMANHNLMTQDS